MDLTRMNESTQRARIFDHRETASPLRILVVDDNVDAAMTFAALLQTTGHCVRTTFDGPTALEAIRQEAPDVIFLDLGLPKMNGYDVAKTIREDLRLDKIVLIAVTGYGSDADRLRSKEARFDHHFLKPADFQIVKETLEVIAKERIA